MKVFFRTLITIAAYAVCIAAHACDLPDSSVVYFKLFNTQTLIPVKKNDFQGEKMVIKNSYFKTLLNQSQVHGVEPFFENIRMKVIYNNNAYYINQEGDIELNNLVIGKLSKLTRSHLDFGYDLYEWETCRPYSEVMTSLLKKHKKHADGLYKKQRRGAAID